jgi:hypothetical protein
MKLGWDMHTSCARNPLADWSDDDCWMYIRERGLPQPARPRLRVDRDTTGAPGAGREGHAGPTAANRCGLHT